MDVKILDSLMVCVCLAVSMGVELTHLIIAHLMLRPSKRERDAQVELAQAQVDKANIKSVQLQLVESSKVERRINNSEKMLEKFKEARVPHTQLVGKVLNILKFVVYAVMCLEYMPVSAVVLKTKSDVFYPYLSQGSVIYFSVWHVLITSALASRYVLRSIQPALFPGAVLP